MCIPPKWDISGRFSNTVSHSLWLSTHSKCHFDNWGFFKYEPLLQHHNHVSKNERKTFCKNVWSPSIIDDR